MSIELLFPLAITLHNIEEALWLPQWSKCAQRFHKPVEKNEFHFALIVVTSIAYLATCFFMFFPGISFFKYLYFGYLGGMVFNAIIPHLAATIVLKKYSPGLITGVFLNIPVNGLIINYSISKGIISLYEVVFSTAGVGAALIALILILFKLGRKLISYN